MYVVIHRLRIVAHPTPKFYFPYPVPNKTVAHEASWSLATRQSGLVASFGNRVSVLRLLDEKETIEKPHPDAKASQDLFVHARYSPETKEKRRVAQVL